MRDLRRTTDEVIVLALCALCIIGLALFAFLRIQRGDVMIAMVDTIGLILAAALFAYVWFTRNLTVAAPLIAVLSLMGAVILIALGGPDERYLLYPTTVVAFLLMKPRWALIGAATAMLAASVLLLPELPVFVFGQFLLSLSGCFLFAYIFARERNIQRDELVVQSHMDPLTGIGNRRAFHDKLDEQLKIHQRNRGVVSLLLLDLDNFKSVNDSRGHDAGDEVLKQVAYVISSRMRAGDYAFRFGGDEFAAIAMGEGVIHLANDLCDKIKAFADYEQLPISVSVGVAEMLPGDDAAAWIKRADVEMYKAKEAGKNQVSMVDESLSQP